MKRDRERLEVGAIITGGFEADLAELLRDVVGGQFDSTRSDAPAFKLIAGEIIDVRMETVLKVGRTTRDRQDGNPDGHRGCHQQCNQRQYTPVRAGAAIHVR